jgi:hypothetical protein
MRVQNTTTGKDITEYYKQMLYGKITKREFDVITEAEGKCLITDEDGNRLLTDHKGLRWQDLVALSQANQRSIRKRNRLKYVSAALTVFLVTRLLLIFLSDQQR